MDKAYREAQKRVKRKKNFYKELMSYVAISLFLVFVNVFTSHGYLWCLWAIVPWGFAMVMRGIQIATSSKSSNWEQKEMRKELRSMGRNPDDYIEEDYLDLKELDKEALGNPTDKGYRNSDLV